MVNYGCLSELERIIMGVFSVSSTLLGIPLAVKLYRYQALRFEAFNVLMLVLTSGLYHLSQVLNQPIGLEQLQWHRLDNIFAITGSSILNMHLLGNSIIRPPLYLALLISIITQCIDPWNLQYTITPIVVLTLLSIVIRIITRKQYIRKYNIKNSIITLIFIVIGFHFFIKGLDQYDDYLRLNHSMWHIFGALFTYYGFFVVKVTRKQQQLDHKFI